jgi:hypothetical protein
MMNCKLRNRTILALAGLLLSLPMTGALAQSSGNDDEHKSRNLALLNYLTGWSLDSGGYHPAIYMLLENTSGRDLSGVTIKMQGKFTDIHTLEPSTARIEVRRSLKPHQQFPVALVAPRDFELSRDPNYWPVMECKAMMRVGNVGDEGTEYLVVTKVEQTTATQDDAFQKLNEQTSYNRSSQSSGRHEPREKPGGREPGSEKTPVKPLVAKAEQLKPLSPAAVSSAKTADIFSVKPLPVLGDDFYSFEKGFGLPVAIDAKKKNFTWAKYRHAGSGLEVIVASRERSGKVDLIAFLIPRASVKSGEYLMEQCKLFCGSKHQFKAGPASKSVRYLPSGRLELLSLTSPNQKILSMALPDANDRPASYLVMISRLSQGPDEVLRSHQSTTDILKNLPLGELPSDKD